MLRAEKIERSIYAGIGLFILLGASGLVDVPESIVNFLINISGSPSHFEDLANIENIVVGFFVICLLVAMFSGGLSYYLTRLKFDNDHGKYEASLIGLFTSKINNITQGYANIILKWGVTALIAVLLGSLLTLLIVLFQCGITCPSVSPLLYILSSFFIVLAFMPKNINTE